jgi:hypothetical protein
LASAATVRLAHEKAAAATRRIVINLRIRMGILRRRRI